jgi:uncharacterized protein
MQNLKIVVTGAYAAGKTQFIKSISDFDALDTEETVTLDDELELKNHTTVALDFGMIQINPELVLHLYGTPGQERFDFMWDILSQGCLGYVVVVDSTRPAHLREAVKVIQHFNRITPAPFVIAANKQDDPTCLPIEYIQYRLGFGDAVPVLPCVATDRESVKSVLLNLLNLM